MAARLTFHDLLVSWFSGLFALWCGACSAADLRVLTAGAFKPVLLAVQPQFEQQTGHRLLIQNDTAGGLQKRVLEGEAFDVVISSPASLKAMREAGKVTRDEPPILARVAIGVAVRADAAVPDISSVNAFRHTLQQARKVAYIDPASGGSSGVYLDGLFERWGIRDEIRAKAVLVPGGLVATRLLDGSADLAIHQISEIKAVPQVRLVGALPKDIQNYTVYAAAASTQAQGAVGELLTFLRSPQWTSVLLDKGMEP